MLQKTCSSCNSVLSTSNFHKDKSRADGLSNRCKRCRCKYDEVVYKNCVACGDAFFASGQSKAQVYCGKSCQQLYLKYGISEYDYEDMLISQEYACAICKVKSDKLAVDHCHATGHVRGLLCVECNTAIGTMKDDPQRLRSAALYIETFEANKPDGIRTLYTGDVKYRRKRGVVKACPSFDARAEYRDL